MVRRTIRKLLRRIRREQPPSDFRQLITGIAFGIVLGSCLGVAIWLLIRYLQKFS